VQGETNRHYCILVNVLRQLLSGRLRCDTQRAGQRNVPWNLKSTTLLEIPWCRVRSSSCNPSAPPVDFRSWCAQLKNWSNTKTCTEHNAARQTPLHNLHESAVLNCRIVKILTLLMVIIPTPVRSHANFVHVPGSADTRIRDVFDELDPDDTGDCLSLGELDIVFRTGNDGPPNIGVVLTDPRGRRFGVDPLIKHAWQALPVAQGDIDCDDLGRTNTCRGIVQVCGPISGTYRLEVIALKTTAYSVSVFARSGEVFDGNSLQSHFSKTDLNNLAIRKRSREIVLLHYSRDPQEYVTARLQAESHSSCDSTIVNGTCWCCSLASPRCSNSAVTTYRPWTLQSSNRKYFPFRSTKITLGFSFSCGTA